MWIQQCCIHVLSSDYVLISLPRIAVFNLDLCVWRSLSRTSKWDLPSYMEYFAQFCFLRESVWFDYFKIRTLTWSIRSCKIFVKSFLCHRLGFIKKQSLSFPYYRGMGTGRFVFFKTCRIKCKPVAKMGTGPAGVKAVAWGIFMVMLEVSGKCSVPLCKGKLFYPFCSFYLYIYIYI